MEVRRMCMYECCYLLQVRRPSAEQWYIALLKVYYNDNTSSNLVCLRHNIWIHGRLGTPTHRRHHGEDSRTIYIHLSSYKFEKLLPLVIICRIVERPVGRKIKCQILGRCVLCHGRCEFVSSRLR